MKIFDLKAFRKDKGITQAELADFFGCNQNFISRIEGGIRSIPADKLEILEAEYGDISKYYQERPTQSVGNISNSSVAGVNVSGSDIHINPNAYDTLLKIVEAQQKSTERFQDEIDRLLTMLEKQVNNR